MPEFGRPFRHLCPEADYRDSLSDEDFWAHVFSAYVGDDDEPIEEEPLTMAPCPVCGELGACAYDGEGQVLIHSIREEVEGDA